MIWSFAWGSGLTRWPFASTALSTHISLDDAREPGRFFQMKFLFGFARNLGQNEILMIYNFGMCGR
jgi:hypothetical protein